MFLVTQKYLENLKIQFITCQTFHKVRLVLSGTEYESCEVYESYHSLETDNDERQLTVTVKVANCLCDETQHLRFAMRTC